MGVRNLGLKSWKQCPGRRAPWTNCRARRGAGSTACSGSRSRPPREASRSAALFVHPNLRQRGGDQEEGADRDGTRGEADHPKPNLRARRWLPCRCAVISGTSSTVTSPSRKEGSWPWGQAVRDHGVERPEDKHGDGRGPPGKANPGGLTTFSVTPPFLQQLASSIPDRTPEFYLPGSC